MKTSFVCVLTSSLRHRNNARTHNRDYFAKNPIPGLAPPSPSSSSATPPGQIAAAPDAEKPGEVRRFANMGWGVKSLAFSPDGTLLAVGKSDGTLMIYELATETRTAFLERLENLGEVTSLAFTPDGTKLLSGGYKGRIQVWNVGSGGTLTEANRFVGHSQDVLTISISRDGKTVLSGGAEKKARVWDLASGRETFAIDGFDGAVKETFLNRAVSQGLACDGETLALIDMRQGKVIQTMKLTGSHQQAVAIAPDGSRIVVSDTYALRTWDIRSGKESPLLQDQEIQWTARFLPNSKYILKWPWLSRPRIAIS